MISQIPWADKKVAIVGDIILDQYVYGHVERISPEAPVPVLMEVKNDFRLGGAANVALNVKRLGGEPCLIGVVGDDPLGSCVFNILADHGIGSAHLLVADDRPTTVKTRYMTEDGHQLLRVDHEEVKDISEQQVNLIVAALNLCGFDALIIADYGKGVITALCAEVCLALAKHKKKPSLVDPKRRDFATYVGCTMITPNKKEAAEALGINPRGVDGRSLAFRLKVSYGFPNVLVTLGAEGMALVEGDHHYAEIKPENTKEVFDVCGAGDTVIATMALGMAAKMELIDAANWASIAAGVAIQRQGTYAPEFAELIGRKK